MRQTPRWMTVVSYVAVAGAFGAISGAVIVAFVRDGTPDADLAPGTDPADQVLFVRLVALGLVSLGVSFAMAFIYSIHLGHFYSGIARREFHKKHDPYHFWILLLILSPIPVFLIELGIYKFVVPGG